MHVHVRYSSLQKVIHPLLPKHLGSMERISDFP